MAVYDGAWWYFASGILNDTYTGFIDWNGGKYYLINGQIDTGNSTVQTDTDGQIYRLRYGKVRQDFTAIYYYDGQWYYFQDGKVNTSYVGMIVHNGTNYCV